jgi:hypothetical protein
MIFALKVQTPVTANALGPYEILPVDPDERTYKLSIARQMLTAVVHNYPASNAQSHQLRKGFLCFRNGATALIAAGVALPFAGIVAVSH